MESAEGKTRMTERGCDVRCCAARCVFAAVQEKSSLGDARLVLCGRSNGLFLYFVFFFRVQANKHAKQLQRRPPTAVAVLAS